MSGEALGSRPACSQSPRSHSNGAGGDRLACATSAAVAAESADAETNEAGSAEAENARRLT